MIDQTRINDWEVIEEQINKSRIRRFSYKKLLGESLTSMIHKLRNKGMDSTQVYEVLITNPKIVDFIDSIPKDKDKLLENIKISVSARFGESKTKERIEHELLEG